MSVDCVSNATFSYYHHGQSQEPTDGGLELILGLRLHRMASIFLE
jgi:hypothetical protein